VGRDISVGITTRYGLDVPGIESRRGEIFFTRPYRASQLSIQWVTGLFPGDKTVGAWPWPPTPHLAPRLKKK